MLMLLGSRRSIQAFTTKKQSHMVVQLPEGVLRGSSTSRGGWKHQSHGELVEFCVLQRRSQVEQFVHRCIGE